MCRALCKIAGTRRQLTERPTAPQEKTKPLRTGAAKGAGNSRCARGWEAGRGQVLSPRAVGGRLLSRGPCSHGQAPAAHTTLTPSSSDGGGGKLKNGEGIDARSRPWPPEGPGLRVPLERRTRLRETQRCVAGPDRGRTARRSRDWQGCDRRGGPAGAHRAPPPGQLCRGGAIGSPISLRPAWVRPKQTGNARQSPPQGRGKPLWPRGSQPQPSFCGAAGLSGLGQGPPLSGLCCPLVPRCGVTGGVTFTVAVPLRGADFSSVK
ncbi:PREDICTED: uncharacterized protein LOC106149402 [Chinchilla lanigera]|uniref:uncharacterized protein LOC106149402 n=1 Tax=Chinchilla lanigera TaxID=34839 RepID=UPI0006990226|nr:PREDICTED: uncharacterized protein LOC106149402 [Chinchilla lanigera]